MYNRPPVSSAFPAESRSPYPRLQPDGRAQEMAAVLSKLVPETPSQRIGKIGLSTDRQNLQNKSLENLDMSLLSKISDTTANDVNDARSIFQLLPETQLAMQILVSSILSPKDMVTVSLNFTLEQNRFNSELATAMKSVISEHFEKVYKIRELLTPSLEDSLFMTGSYPLLILPESSIDHAINQPGRVSMESIGDEVKGDQLKHVGFLNSPQKLQSRSPNLGLEALMGTYQNHEYDSTMTFTGFVKEEDQLKEVQIDPMISVVDNPNLLKMPALRERLASDRAMELMSKHTPGLINGVQFAVSQESFGAHTEYSLGTRRQISQSHVPLMIMPTARDTHRQTVGHPLVMKLPSESVVPVHQPSNPRKHLGYFVLVDDLGNPINTVDTRDYYTDMANSLNTNSSMGSQMLAQAKRALEGQETTRQSEIDEMARIYGRMLEKGLQERLRNVYGDQAEVTAPEEVYRVMLARSLAHRRTQALYVPAEMMTYIAFDYNKYGIGQSLLQQSKILGGIRVITLLADAIAGIKNSINRTQLEIQLDPNDQNPSQTVEFLLHEYAKTRQGIFPMGATNPVDINSYLQKASLDVLVQGNTRFPEVKMTATERQSNRIKPDTEMSDKLRDSHLQSMGLTPDMIDAGQGADFATSVLANNLLLAKRVLNYQEEFEAFLNDFVIKYVLADGALMGELRQLVQDNRNKLTRQQQRAQEISEENKEQRDALVKGKTKVSTESMNERLEDLEKMGQDSVIMEFLQSLRVQLPKPDMATSEAQMTAYSAREQFVEKGIDNFLSEAALAEQGLGDLKELVGPVKEMVKSKMMRDWMAQNNVLPELFELISNPDADEQPDLVRGIEDHFKTMSKSLLHVMYAMAVTQRRHGPAVERLKKIVSPDDGFGGGASYDYQDAPANGDPYASDVMGDGGDMGGGDALDSAMPAEPAGPGGEEDPSADGAAESEIPDPTF